MLDRSVGGGCSCLGYRRVVGVVKGAEFGGK